MLSFWFARILQMFAETSPPEHQFRFNGDRNRECYVIGGGVRGNRAMFVWRHHGCEVTLVETYDICELVKRSAVVVLVRGASCALDCDRAGDGRSRGWARDSTFLGAPLTEQRRTTTKLRRGEFPAGRVSVMRITRGVAVFASGVGRII